MNRTKFCAASCGCGKVFDPVRLGLDDGRNVRADDCAAALQPRMRIVFITGFAAVALSPGSGAPQGAKVLSKPIHLRDIVAEVEKLMAA